MREWITLIKNLKQDAEKNSILKHFSSWRDKPQEGLAYIMEYLAR